MNPLEKLYPEKSQVNVALEQEMRDAHVRLKNAIYLYRMAAGHARNLGIKAPDVSLRLQFPGTKDVPDTVN